MFDLTDLLEVNPRRKLEQMLASRCAAGDAFALMLVELEGFDATRAKYGDTVADLLLYEVARRLRESLREQDVVMRSDENQFAIVVLGAEAIDATEQKARELIERIERPMTVSGTRFRLGASIGITLFPRHGDEWRQLLDNADATAYDARTQGRGTVHTSKPPT